MEKQIIVYLNLLCATVYLLSCLNVMIKLVHIYFTEAVVIGILILSAVGMIEIKIVALG